MSSTQLKGAQLVSARFSSGQLWPTAHPKITSSHSSKIEKITSSEKKIEYVIALQGP
jgi:hypothetical protein